MSRSYETSIADSSQFPLTVLSNGIAYDSVRREDGECVAVFRPRLLSNGRQERHLCYVWNGEKIVSVYEKREFQSGGNG